VVYQRSSAIGSGVRTFVGLALLTAGFLGTLATILGFFGSTSWFFDVLANFRFQLAIGLILIGIAYLLGFGRASAFVFIVMGVINAGLVAPLYLDKPVEAANGASLRIVSYNVQSGRSDPAAVIEWVNESGADLVFLLESSEEWAGRVRTQSSAYSINNEIPEDRYYGITVLGKSPNTIEQLRLGPAREPVVRVEASLSGEPVAIYAIQPRPPRSGATADARVELFNELAALVSAESIPVVVIGDFNATPWSYVFREFTSATGLINSQNGFGLSATWPASLPVSLVPLDHMLHSDSLTTVARDVGPDLGSDHRPLTVELAKAVP